MTAASANPFAGSGPAGVADPTTDSRWRTRLVVMSVLPFALHGAICVLAWAMGSLHGEVALRYILATGVLLSVFALLETRRRHWGWSRARMSAFQLMTGILPCVYVLYWMDSIGGRAAMAAVALASTSFGVISLNTRRTLMVAAAYALSYLVVLCAMQLTRPQVIQWPGDMLMFLAFVASVTQLAVMGGYLFGLRAKLLAQSAALIDSTEQLAQMAMRDELTQALNRRSLMQRLTEEMTAAQSSGTPLSLALIDLDHFKSINDTFGHQAGDTVLRQVAQALSAGTRARDVFGRYGGEEFLLVLPQTPLAGAAAQAERVREQVAGMAFEHALAGAQISVSIGVAQWQPGWSLAQWVDAADAALYRAKAGGRNQVQKAAATPST